MRDGWKKKRAWVGWDGLTVGGGGGGGGGDGMDSEWEESHSLTSHSGKSHHQSELSGKSQSTQCFLDRNAKIQKPCKSRRTIL